LTLFYYITGIVGTIFTGC